jgi:hypothetical protein
LFYVFKEKTMLLFVFLCVALSAKLAPIVGQEIVYSVSGTVDSKGKSPTVTSQNSIGSLQGVFATKCLSSNASVSVFVCNMFDVVVAVSQGQGALTEPRTIVTGSQPLGDDMYYWQTPNGVISQVAYESDDSLYYVQVKLAAINAFQTR